MNNVQELHLNLMLGDKIAFSRLVDYNTLSTKGYQSFTVLTGDIDIDKVDNNIAKVEYKSSNDFYRHLVGFIELH